MNLQDLEKKQIQKSQKMVESYFGPGINFENLSTMHARSMLARINNLLEQFLRTPAAHYREQNPSYLKLMVIAEGLQAKINDRQTINESDVQQAQVVLAAQDFVDRVQDMLEDVSEMQFKDLPALVNSVKSEVGVNEASQFNADASAALKTMLDNLQQSKQQLESAIGIITGQAPIVPGSNMNADTGLDAAPASPAANLGADADLDLDLDQDAEDPLSAKTAALGRDRR